MRRRLLVIYKDRKLLVNYEMVPGINEFLAFKVALQDVLESDANFVQMMDTHFPVVEYFDDNFQEHLELNVTCEMPPSSSKLNLKFIPYITPNQQDTEESVQGATLELAQEANVLRQETENSGASASHLGTELEPSENDKKELTKKGCKRIFPRFNLQSLEMPPFSKRLQKIIDDGNLTLQTNLFVQEAADHLMSIVPYPTPSEYALYCKALTQKFPTLAVFDHNTGRDYEALKTCITNRVRNQRHRAARYQARDAKRAADRQNLQNQPSTRLRSKKGARSKSSVKSDVAPHQPSEESEMESDVRNLIANYLESPEGSGDVKTEVLDFHYD